jgi:hypothetical protein
VKAVLPDAFTIAILAAIESLLSCVVADSMVNSRHNSNAELVAQGVGNIASVLFGGIPATGAIARTAANAKNGGRTPVAGMVHAVVLLLVLLFLMPLAGLIPMPTIAAILFMVAFNMSEYKKFIHTLKTAPKNLSLNCGLIKGGTATNAVADKCEFSIEARVETIESFNLAKEFFNQISKKQFVDGTTTQFEVVSDRPPMERKVFNIELLNKINKINEKYGFEILKERSSLGGSDASYTTEQGIPTADGLGMIGYNLHSNEEKAEIKSLTDGAKNLLAIIMEI